MPAFGAAVDAGQSIYGESASPRTDESAFIGWWVCRLRINDHVPGADLGALQAVRGGSPSR